MIWNNPKLQSIDCVNNSSGIQRYNLSQKPIEIYAFIDPLGSECWSLEPYLKKLTIEYGQYFTIRQVIVNRNIQAQLYEREVELNIGEVDYLSIDSWAAYAIKSAELQGKNAGRNFLRKLQASFFIKHESIQDINVLIQCAEDAKLDIDEFKRDLFSKSAQKALLCDYRLSLEMNVNETPTIVFFNTQVDEQGVKVCGIYPYEIYVHVLGDILQQTPIPKMKPSLEEYIAKYEVVSNKEISIVFDWSPAEVEKRLRKLELKQKLIKKISRRKVFWKYIHSN